MSAAVKRMPACIFEEMAGIQNISPLPSKEVADNINQEEKPIKVDSGRLKEVGKALVKKTPQFCNYIFKLFKKLTAYQQGVKEKKSKKPSFISINFKAISNVVKKPGRLLIKIVNWVKGKFLGLLESVVKGVFKTAKWVLKWAFKIMWKTAKLITELLWKTIKFAFKTLVKLLKWSLKILGKTLRLLWKGFVNLAKVFWRLMKRLFIKKKSPFKAPYLLNEPPGLTPKDPIAKIPSSPSMQTSVSIIKSGNNAELMVGKAENFKTSWASSNKLQSTFNYKGRRSRVETFLWKIIKRILKAFWKVLRKLIKRVFGKIIDKLIGVTVKIIVRFVVAQVVGSLLPGIGNAIALAATAINAIMLIGDAISFIKGLADTVDDLKNGLVDNEEYDDAEEQEETVAKEDIKKRKKEISDYRNRMEELAAEGKENTVEYNENKKQYMLELLKQAQASGDLSEVKALKDAMGIVIDKNGNESAPNMEKIKEVDLAALNRQLIEEQEKELQLNRKKNKTAIINNDELDKLLVAANGEPEWMVIVKRLVLALFDRIENRYKNKEKYEWAVRNALILNEVPEIKAEYIVPREEWLDYHQNRKNEKLNFLIASANVLMKISSDKAIDVMNSPTISALLSVLVNHPTHLAKLVPLLEKNTVNLMDETEVYRKSIKECNKMQRRKTNAWIDILTLLTVRKVMHTK